MRCVRAYVCVGDNERKWKEKTLTVCASYYREIWKEQGSIFYDRKIIPFCSFTFMLRYMCLYPNEFPFGGCGTICRLFHSVPKIGCASPRCICEQRLMHSMWMCELYVMYVEFFLGEKSKKRRKVLTMYRGGFEIEDLDNYQMLNL